MSWVWREKTQLASFAEGVRALFKAACADVVNCVLPHQTLGLPATLMKRKTVILTKPWLF